MYYLDLFSGIGGFALGAYWAGWRFDEHYFSEIDRYCIDLYKRRFPDAIGLGNISTHERWNLPEGDYFITGGFPCQDISIAGKGEGIGGERSGLWFEMWRIIRDLRPRWVIAENVGAITFRGLSTVLNSLAEIGYDAEWQDIRASDMGAPHRRERIWILAYPTEFGCGTGRHRLSERQNSTERQYSKENKQDGERQRDRVGETSQDVADTEFKQKGSPHPQEVPRVDSNSSQIGAESRDDIRNSNTALQERSRPGEWLTEPDVGRLAHGIPHRVDRLRALGNSIVPQIAELLFRRIAEIDENI